MMGFAENLKRARLDRGLTQVSVAEQLGIDKSTYSGYESGKRQPDVNRIKELAGIFNVSADLLIGVSQAFPSALDGSRDDSRFAEAISNRQEVRQLVELALISSTEDVWKIIEIWRVIQKPIKSKDPAAPEHNGVQ